MTTDRPLHFPSQPAAFPDAGIVLHGSGDGIQLVVEPLNETWLVVYYFSTLDRAPAITEIRVVPVPAHGITDAIFRNLVEHEPACIRPERPLAARMLQQLRPGRALRTLRGVLGSLDDASLTAQNITRDLLAATPTRAQRQRRHDPKERERWLARIADVYLRAVHAGSTSPVADTAATLDIQPKCRVRDLLREARNKNLLLSPGGGDRRAGGQLTEKARHLLAG